MWYFFLLISLHGLILLTTQFTAWPEMLAYSWLMGQGYELYGDIIHPYLPLLPWFLRFWYRVFGLSVESLRLLTVFIFLIIDGLVFYISEIKYGVKMGLLSLIVFMIGTTLFAANGMWFDLFGLPFILLAYFWLSQSRADGIKWKLAAGIALGMAVIVKQTNLIYILPALLILGWYKHKSLIFVAMVMLPLLMVTLFYATTDQFTDYIYWGIIHPVFVHSRMPGFAHLPNLREILTILVLFSPVILLIKKRNHLFYWFLASWLFAIPRFDWFHLLPAVTFFCILMPRIYKRVKELKINKFYVRSALLIYTIGANFLFLYRLQKIILVQERFFTPQVFAARERLTQLIPAHESVFFYNTPAQYFVGTHLQPVKPWADLFPWYYEVEGMQEKVINAFEEGETEWVIMRPFGNDGKYTPGTYRPQKLDRYIHANYIHYRTSADNLWLYRRR